MSVIQNIGPDYSKLPKVLSDYEAALEEVEGIIQIKGKKLEHANRENPAWQNYYDQKRVELYTLVKYFEGEVAKVRSTLFKTFKEGYVVTLNEREIAKYIDSEPKYLTITALYLEVKEMYDKYEAVVNAFTSRGYALNNITKIRVAALEDVEL